MRFISLFATTVLFGRALADCCDQAGGISGECADGTDATPCCGVGSCNLFCCNCDGGESHAVQPSNPVLTRPRMPSGR